MQSYDNAIEELQNIVRELQANTIGMDALPERLARADALIRFCRERLRDTEASIEGLFEEESQ
ncbi:MAG: exodeoxyribonuclease VII small subunit [Saprospiraceae bacterium]|jgi:exodeoxyribonuclease VII small subunit